MTVATDAMPKVFHELALMKDGAGGLVPWVGTSFENSFREMDSRRGSDGICVDIGSWIGHFYPAERLTDEAGFPVDDINALYPPPLRIEAQ